MSGRSRSSPRQLSPGRSRRSPARSRKLARRAVAAGLALASALIAVSGCSSSAVSTSRSSAAPASVSGVAVSNCLKVLACYAPRQFRVAYGIQPLLDRGIDGRGETVVLLEFAAPAPASPPLVTDIRQDLVRFDSLFGLPAARLQVVNSLARSPSPWLAGVEEVEDTEIVHAVAPDAGIREVLISDSFSDSPADATTDITAALRLGMTEGAVISFSKSSGEQCFTPAEIAGLNATLLAASDRHVTVVNSSGDSGVVSKSCPGAAAGSAPVKGVNLLDSDPLTLAAGGTSLQASHSTGAYIGETAWNTPADPPARPDSGASGGGFSQVFPRPAYQDGIPGIGAFRGVPDVAADAAPSTGMTLAATEGGQDYILAGASGTSAAAPLWAAVIALADQYAGRPLGFVNPALYRIGRSSLYHRAFHDVTTGSNTVVFSGQTITGYRAGPGWNPVTGLGSPDAQVLVPLLARYASS
jgi:subtilase family serine protease